MNSTEMANVSNSSDSDAYTRTPICSLGNASRHNITRKYWEIYESFQPSAPALAAAMIAIFLVAFSWNSFILYAMIRSRAKLLRTPTHILLFSLAVNDLLLSILVMPFTIVSVISLEFPFGGSDHTRCSVCQQGVLFTILSGVSLHHIALLSLDRFLFIYLPMKYKHWVTRERMVVAVLAVWLLCSVLGVLPLFGFGAVDYSTSIGTCIVFFYGKTKVAPNIYYVLVFLLESLIPITAIVVSNVALLCTARKQLRQLRQAKKKMHSASEDSKLRISVKSEHSKHQLQLLKVFGAIFLANLITWIPVVALAIGSPAIDFNTIPAEAVAFVYVTYISHSVIHPLLESWFILEIRQTVKRIACCWRKGMRKPQTMYSTDAQLSDAVPIATISAADQDADKCSNTIMSQICKCCWRGGGFQFGGRQIKGLLLGSSASRGKEAV